MILGNFQAKPVTLKLGFQTAKKKNPTSVPDEHFSHNHVYKSVFTHPTAQKKFTASFPSSVLQSVSHSSRQLSNETWAGVKSSFGETELGTGFIFCTFLLHLVRIARGAISNESNSLELIIA